MTVQTLAIIVLLVSFFVMIFLRFPIAYAVGLSSVLCLTLHHHAQMKKEELHSREHMSN